MNGSPKYAIDSCSLIRLKEVYPVDLFSPIWGKISELADSGRLISCEEIFDELESMQGDGDEVLDWASAHRSIFYPLDENVQRKATEILAIHPHLLDLKKGKSSGDPFLIATAMIYECIVVSDENPSGGPRKVKIPDVCNYHSLKCIRLLDMLRAEGIRFYSKRK